MVARRLFDLVHLWDRLDGQVMVATPLVAAGSDAARVQPVGVLQIVLQGPFQSSGSVVLPASSTYHQTLLGSVLHVQHQGKCRGCILGAPQGHVHVAAAGWRAGWPSLRSCWGRWCSSLGLT